MKADPKETSGAGEFRDPVCGMSVSPESPWRTTYQGREYAFCCRPCLAKFKDEPEKYLAAGPVPAGGVSTFPGPSEAAKLEPRL